MITASRLRAILFPRSPPIDPSEGGASTPSRAPPGRIKALGERRQHLHSKRAGKKGQGSRMLLSFEQKAGLPYAHILAAADAAVAPWLVEIVSSSGLAEVSGLLLVDMQRKSGLAP